VLRLQKTLIKRLIIVLALSFRRPRIMSGQAWINDLRAGTGMHWPSGCRIKSGMMYYFWTINNTGTNPDKQFPLIFKL